MCPDNEIGAAPLAQPQRICAAAERALAEAADRRAARKAAAALKELNGRDGPDPVRFGDWEVKGIACDF